MASIFSKIIAGEIPCYKVAENENFFAFLDIRPVSRGHTLVIPKMEVDYVFDLNEHTYSGLMGYCWKVARAMDQALQPIRIAMTVEGLEVPHAHIHLIPIYSVTGPFRLGHSIKLEKEEMYTISEQIAKHLD
ncbi:MAG: HIT family protein [Balneola sp.]|nr:HIT family protein [Balneola sp.]|tara:strand:- start:33 stop:428 length:396 start_codon:yes stop_codon:yes gene_type:complete